MKHSSVFFMVWILLIMSGCSNISSDVTIEYGDKVVNENYFDLKEGEKLSLNITVDSKVIGVYDVKATITGQTKREENKKIKVEDTEKAEIKLLQSEKTFEIPFQASYNPIGNIDTVTDKVDGEYKVIDLVSQDEYDKRLKTIKDFRKKAKKQIFESNDQIKNYKKYRLRSGYTLLTSDVDTKKAGTYTIHAAVVDHGYNVTEVSYKVKVQELGIDVNKEKLAVGVKGTQMGKAISYKVNKQTESEKKETKEEKPVDNGQAETSPKQESTQSSNTASNETIDAQGSPVLQAALNYVGADMACDELATMALVKGGYLTGTPEKIFRQGNYYNIGVYQMPAIGTYISEGEAVPGDLILYDDGGVGSMHVAVYAGNGKAVHGGFNNKVVINSVYIGTGPKYFRVPPMTWSDVSMKVYGHATDENGNMIWPETEYPSTAVPPPDNSGSSPDYSEILNGDDFGGNGNVVNEYTTTVEINGTTLTVKSSSPIDDNYMSEQMMQYAQGIITMEQLKANLEAKGYTVTN